MNILFNHYYPKQESINKLIDDINKSSGDSNMYNKLKDINITIYSNYINIVINIVKTNDKFDLFPTGEISKAYDKRIEDLKNIDTNNLDDSTMKMFEEAAARYYIMDQIVYKDAFYLAEFKVTQKNNPTEYDKYVYNHFKKFIESFLQDTDELVINLSSHIENVRTKRLVMNYKDVE